MNFKMAILSNWKTLLLIVQLSIIAVQVIAMMPLGDPIDDPIMPG
jgi:hypothetical protein